MIVNQYQYGPEKTNAFLIVSNNHSILVDAPSDKLIYELDKLNNVTLDYIILSHEHADHLWGLNTIREQFNCKVIGQKICSRYIQDCRNNKARHYHVYYAIKYKGKNTDLFNPLYCCDPVDVEFDDYLELQWQGNKLRLFHTPGHSEGSVLIALNDSLIFSGDTILKEQKTFTGFTNGSEEEYQKYTKPIIEKIDGNKNIYPGHGDPFYFKEWEMEEAEMSNKAKYYGVFVEIFEIEENVLDDNFNFKDIENWDSLTHLSLITALEDTFDVMFETDDILHFGGFMNGMKILERYGVDFAE